MKAKVKKQQKSGHQWNRRNKSKNFKTIKKIKSKDGNFNKEILWITLCQYIRQPK